MLKKLMALLVVFALLSPVASCGHLKHIGKDNPGKHKGHDK